MLREPSQQWEYWHRNPCSRMSEAVDNGALTIIVKHLRGVHKLETVTLPMHPQLDFVLHFLVIVPYTDFVGFTVIAHCFEGVTDTFKY